MNQIISPGIPGIKRAIEKKKQKIKKREYDKKSLRRRKIEISDAQYSRGLQQLPIKTKHIIPLQKLNFLFNCLYKFLKCVSRLGEGGQPQRKRSVHHQQDGNYSVA